MKNQKNKAFCFVILAGVLWGTSGIFVKLLAPYGLSTMTMTALRGLISFLCMAIYAIMIDPKLFRVRGLDLLLVAGSGIAFFGTGSCYFLAMQMTSVSTAVVLMYTAPILVMVVSVLFFGEKLTRLKVVSVVCMLGGCCLVAGIIGGMAWNPLGILIGFGAGIAYAGYNILTKLQMKRGIHPITAVLYCFFFMMLCALCFAKPSTVVSAIGQAPLKASTLILGLGICTSTLPYFFYTGAMKELPAGTSSALAIVEPMSATVFSVLLFHEHLSIPATVGIVLILLAVFLLSRTKE